VRRRRHQPQRIRFLGGLPAVAALTAALASSACSKKDDAPLAPTARSQSVVATGPADTATAPPAQASAPEKPKEVKKPRKLCVDEIKKPGRPFPTVTPARAAAKGVAEPPAAMPIGKSGWTWVNLWAAWCAPCKQEMPLLLSWQKQLGAHMQVLFVSMDDDERQLHGFLDGQPESGMRSTYWLPDGKKREDFLKDAHIDEDTALPVQLLVDPKGEVRCVVHGAIEDSDLAQVRKIVGG
jgi:thiol-disulfide isomerase/thioredoxin